METERAGEAAIRRDIQGLRAVAVILVILSHLPAPLKLAGGFVGVDIFFVISGFVIARILVRPSSGARFYVTFMGRRMARLVPALFVVSAAAVLLSIVFCPTTELEQIAVAGSAATGFVSNFYYAAHFDTYWNPAVLRSPFLHTWSLGVEFQIYLVLPLLFLGSSRRLAKRVALIGTFMAASYGLFVYLLVVRKAPLHGLDPKGLAFYVPLTRFWEFGLGVLPALVERRSSGQSAKALAVAWILILGGVVTSTFAKGLNLSVLACCLGVTVLLIVGGHGAAPGRSLIESRPLVWIGDRSYSIYLWHWPMLVLCVWVFPGRLFPPIASIVITGLCSALTYRFIEQRFRRRRDAQDSAIPGWLGVVVGAAAALAIAWKIARAPWYSSSRPIASVAMPFRDAAVSTADVISKLDGGCHVLELEREIHCNSVPGDPGEVVVIGDSLAYRTFPALNLAARQRGLNASMLWSGDCGIAASRCSDRIHRYLRSKKPVALVVSTSYNLEGNRLNGTQIAIGVRAKCSPDVPTKDCAAHRENVAKWEADAIAGLKELESYTDWILVALPFPQQAKLVPECLSLPLYNRFISPAYDGEGCGRTSLAWQRETQGLFPETIRRVVAGHPNVRLWDPAEYLCDGTWCPAVINDGERIMDDGIHWTWEASRYLYPALNAFLEQRPAH